MLYLEDENVAWLWLGREQLESFIHKYFIFGGLCSLRCILVLSLNYHLHFHIFQAVGTACVHECEKYLKLLPCVYFSKWRIVADCCICLNTIIAYVIGVQELGLRTVYFLLSGKRNCLELDWIVEGGEFVLEFGLRQPLYRSWNQLIELEVHT